MFKKATLLLFATLLMLGCSPDATNSLENSSIDLTQLINPDSVKALAKYDTGERGIYRGIFVGNDMSHHGVLTINNENDGNFNAVLVTTNNVKLGFIGRPSLTNSIISKVVFEGDANTRFTLTFADSEHPIIEEAFIMGKPATAKVLKETSENRVMVSLGTYVDDSNPSFNGTWDFLSTETETIIVPTGLPFPATVPITVNIISELVLVTAGGGMFTDTVMENFTAGSFCPDTFPTGSQRPFFSGEQTIGGVFNINEFAAGNQTSPLNGTDANWTFLYSFANGSAYYDTNCNVLTAGTWSWNGRTGSILLD
ncbi:hypothetical protein [Cochleicola gelatinilyticus]|uniref:DUF5689 domain-containing protein n=1 Tax=Cochleicola gelatinilyticus TaxID=1763537 RepID=A0A167H644_9FLAO|nr:hypothetical protein [Cochleicola gelatinilyticus]OAB78253.1 hypothetical protein ULVI_12315 [Cochleicola gelatinilyticus]